MDSAAIQNVHSSRNHFGSHCRQSLNDDVDRYARNARPSSQYTHSFTLSAGLLTHKTMPLSAPCCHHPRPRRLTRSLGILLSVHNLAVSGTSSPAPFTQVELDCNLSRKLLRAIGMSLYPRQKLGQPPLAKLVNPFSTSLGLTPLICKVNTALQLLLMGTTTITPILPIDIGLPLQGLQYVLRSKSYIQTHLIYFTRT